ncbi:hypothetical protein [Algoriphagus sp.]|uniref:hypothetical protein n=1 Tax=Algoriphagus sp. TaxID=1872435 RepID=UPI003F719F64
MSKNGRLAAANGHGLQKVWKENLKDFFLRNGGHANLLRDDLTTPYAHDENGVPIDAT